MTGIAYSQNQVALTNADHDLVGIMHKFHLTLKRRIIDQLKKQEWLMTSGCKPGCIAVLLALQCHTPISQKDLSEKVLIDPSDMVQIIDILEKAQFVKRERDSNDRRRYRLTVTDEGAAAAARAELILGDIYEEILAPLDDSEKTMLMALMHKISEAVN